MSLFSKRAAPPVVSAIVAAAGTASRMGGIDKQQFMLDGMPVVVRSIGCLEECGLITEIIVVCRGECIAEYYDLVRFFSLTKVTSVVAGGETRQDSVFAGLSACRPDAMFFAIHDGARPLTAPEEVERCIGLAMRTGAAAVGVPVKDTIKLCDEHGVIVSTPPRDRLWAVQTPQVFEARLYRRAMDTARRDNRLYTDDCQLMEAAGHPVAISPGSYENIKITTPEDAALARAILKYRGEGLQEWQFE